MIKYINMHRHMYLYMELLWWLRGKASACNAGDLCSIPGSGRSPGEENGNPLQYTCLENSMDGGGWWATVHGVAKSWARLTHSLVPLAEWAQKQ